MSKLNVVVNLLVAVLFIVLTGVYSVLGIITLGEQLIVILLALIYQKLPFNLKFYD